MTILYNDVVNSHTSPLNLYCIALTQWALQPQFGVKHPYLAGHKLRAHSIQVATQHTAERSSVAS